jgi:hypothetical protein
MRDQIIENQLAPSEQIEKELPLISVWPQAITLIFFWHSGDVGADDGNTRSTAILA